MSVLDRLIGELPALRTRTAEESLTSPDNADKTAYGFGRAVGRVEGVRLVEEMIQRLLSEQEASESGTGRHRRAS